MSEPRWSRQASFGWVAAAYVAGLAAASVTLAFLPTGWGELWAVGVADLVATIVIFAFSRGLRCSSVYDPYWSIAPIAIVLYWAFHGSEGVNPIRAGAVIFCVAWWGGRLTLNWVRGWPGLHHQDWRYDEMQKRAPSLWFLSDFFGIHVYPTVQVFFALTGAWVAITQDAGPISWIDVVAFIVTTGAITIETIADQQMRAFAKVKKSGEIMATGLWAYSRHPNYFGELSFWWGLYLFGVAADPRIWWTVFGPLAMTAMFLGASIPWMDRRSCERRPEYAEHMRKVSALVPWFPKGS